MSISKLVAAYPIGWTIVSLGSGAAFVVAVLGIPDLWSAEAAGWASAGATVAAVVVALVTAHRQLGVAQHAANEARETAFSVQSREWRSQQDTHRQTAIRLAHAFGRELSYARRPLVSALLDWEPDRFAQAPLDTYQLFVNPKPFPDLVLIRACTDRLQGFADADSFMILTVLTTWQFFNSAPAGKVEEVISCSVEQREEMARIRVRFGLQLLDLVDEAINAMSRYYADHPAVVGTADTDLSLATRDRLRALRTQV